MAGRQQDNSGTNETRQLSEKLQGYAAILHREMKPEEINWWVKFLSQYRLAEVEYAFDSWLRNRTSDEWWPSAQRIAELCEAYGGVQRQQGLPVGCPRCDWTGFYMTAARRTIKHNEVPEGTMLAAECPCKRDVSLRTPCLKKRASEAEMRVMWEKVWELCQKKAM